MPLRVGANCAVWAIVAGSFLGQPAAAQTASDPSTSSQSAVTDYYPQKGGVGSRVTVHVSQMETFKAPNTADALRLYLDGRRFADMKPLVDPRNGRLIFELTSTDASKPVWLSLPAGERVTLTVGWEGSALLPVKAAPLEADQGDTVRKFRLEPAVNAFWPQRGSFGDTITVQVTGLANMRAPNTPDALKLFLDGRPILDSKPSSIDLRRGIVQLRLSHTDASKDAWTSLIGSKPVALSVGWEKEGPLAVAASASTLQFSLEPHVGRQYFAAIAFVVFLIAFVCAVFATSMLHNRVVVGTVPGQGPYALSLGRCQMAFWTVIAIGAVLFVFWATGRFVITPQLVILMGISAATAIGAVAVDAVKQGSATAQTTVASTEMVQAQAAAQAVASQAAAAPVGSPEKQALIDTSNTIQTVATAQAQRIATLAAQAWPPQKKSNLFFDLVSDRDGVSLHRLQVVIWTLILGGYFLFELFATFQMPTLTTEFLTLMGISNSTYVGFKFPEVRT